MGSSAALFDHLDAMLAKATAVEDVGFAVRNVGRRLVDCDGVTFVLRCAGHCLYADEDAIAPLWKGQRFPMEMCISGWVMLNRRAVMIPNIFLDPRIPHDVYRRTFVKSLMMVPVGNDFPVAAIGAYWAEFHDPTDHEQMALYSLARAAARGLAAVAA